MNPVVASTIALLLFCAACSAGSTPSPTPTAGVRRATVTDASVPFSSSEADALAPHGFLGSGAYGRLGIGCTVEVLKTTDRAAQVRAISCPQSGNTNVPPSAMGANGVQGWVAKSALDLKP